MSLAALLPLALLTTRIAIVTSSNEATGQTSLRFADRDGERMVTVLRELGSFSPADVWSLPSASAGALRDALDRAERTAEREPGSEILFYFSGHADSEGLLLGGERFSYRELRDRLARSRAQVRVAVLDACNSGGATRGKGGLPGSGPPFAAASEIQVNGAVILAASAADEVAQESGDIGGSYFTHHLISGLRGAADRDGDGLVTLAEAYAYVYGRTLAATVPTLWGPQHPSYDFRLSGSGDLVLTTLRRGRQGIVFAPAAEGIWSVLDASREVIAELRADPRRGMRLALPIGRYRIALRTPAGLTATEIDLREGQDATLDRLTFKRVSPEYAMAKGGQVTGRDGLFVDYALVGRGLAAAGVSSEIGVTLRHNGARWSVAPRLDYGETRPDAVGIPIHLRRFGAATYLLRRIPVGAVDLQLGAGASITRIIQYQLDGGRRFAIAPGAAAALALEIPLGRWIALRFAWDAGVELTRIDGVVRVQSSVRSVFGLGVRR